MDAPADPRAEEARAFACAALSLDAADFAPASADASFRRYFRLAAGGASWIVMDAPPEREDCRPFVRVAGLLQAAGLHVPQVLAQDLERGFLLLTDLGRQTFLDVLDEGNREALFDDAQAALVRWQLASQPGVLPPYDEALLRRELELFPEWYLGRHLGCTLSTSARDDWDAACRLLVDSARAQPQVYVHRDYMPRNLMVSQPSPGVLDFQDAVHGPATYDVVSLYRDAFRSHPEEFVERGAARWYERARAAGAPVPDPGDYRRAFDWMGLQRHLKVLGIFARLTHRDGKPKYVADTPRFVRYVMGIAPRYPQLAPLVRLFDRLVLPGQGGL